MVPGMLYACRIGDVEYVEADPPLLIKLVSIGDICVRPVAVPTLPNIVAAMLSGKTSRFEKILSSLCFLRNAAAAI
jgi:hypothetical protein